MRPAKGEGLANFRVVAGRTAGTAETWGSGAIPAFAGEIAGCRKQTVNAAAQSQGRLGFALNIQQRIIQFLLKNL
jgi:hypothetical protein